MKILQRDPKFLPEMSEILLREIFAAKSWEDRLRWLNRMRDFLIATTDVVEVEIKSLEEENSEEEDISEEEFYRE